MSVSSYQARDGFLLLNKKSGESSFESLGDVKKAFGTGKVGHTGTLDKFASGLLVVLIGKAVKLNFLFENCVKEYTGTILFGEETDTLDPEGAVIANGPIPSREMVESALGAFRGDIMQEPPAYSALHINGRRAHELAREGKTPEMKKRPATIHELEIVSWEAPEAIIHAKVSSGTYIRSLARDIGLGAGTRARLSALRRSAVGPFHLEDACKSVSDEAYGEENREAMLKALRPLDKSLFNALSLPCCYLSDKDAEAFLHGRSIDSLQQLLKQLPDQTESISAAGVFTQDEPVKFLGVLSKRLDKWEYGYVFANN